MKSNALFSVCFLIALTGCAGKPIPPHPTFSEAERIRIEQESPPSGYSRYYVCGGGQFFQGNKNESPTPWAGTIGPFAIHELEFPTVTDKSRITVINQDEVAILDMPDEKQVEIFEIPSGSRTILQFVPKAQPATNVRINIYASTRDRLQYLDLSGIYSASGVGGKYMSDTFPAAGGGTMNARKIRFELTDDPQACAGKRLIYYGKF